MTSTTAGPDVDGTCIAADDEAGAPATGPGESEATFDTTGSLLIDRLIARVPLPRKTVVVGAGIVLLILPLIFAYAGGNLSFDLLVAYRSLFVYAFVVVYVLFVFQFLEGTRADVAEALGPLVDMDDGAYAALVARGSKISPAGELIALGIGFVMSLAMTVTLAPGPDASALDRYAYYFRTIIMSIDIWFIYIVFAMTRLTNTLLRQPLDVDLFDLTPFEPIGRQTVWLCLTFVGVLVFGLLGLDQVNQSLYWASMVFFGSIVLFVLAVFYANTRGVHRVLSSKKKERLVGVNHRLALAASELETAPYESGQLDSLSAHINALAVVKQELKQARTWPYNTEMLRAMVISIITPLLVGISRIAAVLLASGNPGR